MLVTDLLLDLDLLLRGDVLIADASPLEQALDRGGHVDHRDLGLIVLLHPVHVRHGRAHKGVEYIDQQPGQQNGAEHHAPVPKEAGQFLFKDGQNTVHWSSPTVSA